MGCPLDINTSEVMPTRYLLVEEYCIKKIHLYWPSANTSNVTSSTLPVKLWRLDIQNENSAP